MGDANGPGSQDPTAQPERSLAGIGRFSWKLALGTAIAIGGALLALRMEGRSLRGMREPDEGAVARRAAYVPVMPPSPSDASPVSPTARDVEKRYAAGALAEAQRRFDPCPGGDVRRVAWIADQQHVRKLIHHKASGLVLEEWFDGEGRLREALVRTTAAGHPWTWQATFDDRGGETIVRDTPGPAPEDPPPALVRHDPTSAFFSGAGCER